MHGNSIIFGGQVVGAKRGLQRGNVLRCLTDSGFRHYLGGARASRGLKAGRYMFEAPTSMLMIGRTSPWQK
eukprot:6337950-Amphidinium_carterae.2